MFHLVQTSRKMLIGQFYEESLIFLSAEDPGGLPNPIGIAPPHAANAPAAAAQVAISPHSPRGRVMEIRGRLHEWGQRQHSRRVRNLRREFTGAIRKRLLG